MDIASIPPASTTAKSEQPTDPNQSDTDTSALASDFETFLKLLTTQLQNQDPSKPLDSTEFVAQLASFSSVEQQINTNTKLDKMISALSASTTSDLANWLGRAVESPAAAEFSGAPLDVTYSVAEKATRADLVVTADDGTVIERFAIDPKKTTLVWAGTDQNQNPFPHGSYSFKIENFEGSTKLEDTAALTFSEVTETRVKDGEISLVFKDGTKMLASDVTSIRATAGI